MSIIQHIYGATKLDLTPALLRTFLAAVETGGYTTAGKVVGRTQPAVSNQIRRLEDTLGCPVFGLDRRKLTLTEDGEVLLRYAREILRLNGEVSNHFSSEQVTGRVVIGTPDLYAAFLMPDILRSFSRTYPNVEIELVCQRSVYLNQALQRGDLDCAIMTKQPGFPAGKVVRSEPLFWVKGVIGHLERQEILPLALLPPGSVIRERALEALRSIGRRWSVVSISDSIAGLQAAIFSGLAVTVIPKCAISTRMIALGPTEELPEIPAIDLVLHRSPQSLGSAAEQLVRYIVENLGVVDPVYDL